MNKININRQTVKYTFSIIFFIVGIMSFLSVFGISSPKFFVTINIFISGLAGALKIFVPIFIIFIGIILLIPNKTKFIYAGIVLLVIFLTLLSLINLFTNIRVSSTNEIMTLFELINRYINKNITLNNKLDFNQAFSFVYNLCSSREYFAQAGGALGLIFSLPLRNAFGVLASTIMLSIVFISLCFVFVKYIILNMFISKGQHIYQVGPYQFTNKKEYQEYLLYLQNWQIQNQMYDQMQNQMSFQDNVMQDNMPTNTISDDFDFSKNSSDIIQQSFQLDPTVVVSKSIPKGKKKLKKEKCEDYASQTQSIDISNSEDINVLMKEENKKRIREKNDKIKAEAYVENTLDNNENSSINNKNTSVISKPKQKSFLRPIETGKRFDDMIPDLNKMKENTQKEETKAESMPYSYPKAALLENPVNLAEDYTFEDKQNSKIIEETLDSFDIPSKVVRICRGPAVTRFEIDIASGIRVNKVVNTAENLALKLSSQNGVRIEAPVPGTTYIGIEIPNKKISPVSFKEVLFSSEMKDTLEPLAIALGKDIAGNPIICNLEKMPHLLIAGATGSGKSVCINSIIMSLIFRCSPDECRLILIDPKFVELSRYNVLPHLLIPVVNETSKASGALSWAVAEMNDRYNMFKNYGVNNIKEFNKQVSDQSQKLPRIVIIIDEMADLMVSTSKKEVEYNVNRLAALARAAGLHLVVATQRPSVNVITGVIKSNLPSRIAFASSSAVDSRTILDRQGAENLLGNGDMLYLPIGMMNPIRVQGCFVKNNEVNTVLEYIKKNNSTNFDQSATEAVENAYKVENQDQVDNNRAITNTDNDSVDVLLEEAIDMVLSDGQASISMLQRRLSIGYARAGRLIDTMARHGIISQSSGSKAREVLMDREQFESIRDKVL